MSLTDCRFAAAWSESAAYVAGDIVRHRGKTYRCLQSHTSLWVWPPDVVQALWKEEECGAIPIAANDADSDASDANIGDAANEAFANEATDAATRGDDGSTRDGAKEATDASTNDGAAIPASDASIRHDFSRIVGYYTSWSTYSRNYQVADIQASKLTHINYAFANLSDAGECALGDPYADTDKAFTGDTLESGVLRGNFGQLKKLKARYPHIKTLLSVGGWTWSSRFSDVALNTESRRRFATSCVALLSRYGFDGLDIDWEYPVGGGLASNRTRPEDISNYPLLLAELRAHLDALGPGHLLTIAAPAAPALYPHFDLPNILGHVDWLNIMAYDFHGGWESQTGLNAPLHAVPGDIPLFSAHDAIESYLTAGAPASKLVMGIPFYGHGWSGVAPRNNGFAQPSTGLPAGTWEPGIFDFKDLAANYVSQRGFVRYWHDIAGVPWLWNAQTQVMISYDDVMSVGLKAQYAKARGLGGVMAWELSGDDKTLLETLHTRLTQ